MAPIKPNQKHTIRQLTDQLSAMIDYASTVRNVMMVATVEKQPLPPGLTYIDLDTLDELRSLVHQARKLL